MHRWLNRRLSGCLRGFATGEVAAWLTGLKVVWTVVYSVEKLVAMSVRAHMLF